MTSSPVPIEQVNYLAGHKSMAMTKRYDHANEERYGGAIEALDEAGKTGSAEALAAAKWKQIPGYSLAAAIIAFSLSLLMAPRTISDPTMMAGVPEMDSLLARAFVPSSTP